MDFIVFKLLNISVEAIISLACTLKLEEAVYDLFTRTTAESLKL